MYTTETPGVGAPREPVNSEPETVINEPEINDTGLLKATAEEAVKIAESAIYGAQAAVASAIAAGELEPCECYTTYFGGAQVRLRNIRQEIEGEAKQQSKTSASDNLAAFLLSQVTS